MNLRQIDKKYIYLREGQCCFYCHKPLKLGQVSLDHYNPKSKGGTYDYFNLVAACVRCNRYKQSRVPNDVSDVHLMLFKRSILDHKLICTVKNIRQSQFDELANRITKITCHENYCVASGDRITLHIETNRIIRIFYAYT